MLYTGASFRQYYTYELCMFILFYIYIQCIHLISVTLLQKNQSGEQIKKKNNIFLPFPNMSHITESTQATNKQ